MGMTCNEMEILIQHQNEMQIYLWIYLGIIAGWQGRFRHRERRPRRAETPSRAGSPEPEPDQSRRKHEGIEGI